MFVKGVFSIEVNLYLLCHSQVDEDSYRGYLRSALNLSTASQDNHLRALVLALIAAQYVHTSAGHAETMLSTADQLASGLGARPKLLPISSRSPGKVAAGSNDGVGNAPLRLWIGERSLGSPNISY